LAVQPPGLVAGADLDTRQAAHARALVETAHWLGFVFPDLPRWRLEAALANEDQAASAQRRERNRLRLKHQADLLVQAPSLWRRRSTPGGFLTWLCCWFDLDRHDPAACPVLIEHHAFPDAETSTHPVAFHLTLLIPQGERFTTYAEISELVQWLTSRVPAHLVVHHYLIPRAAWSDLHGRVLKNATSLADVLHTVRNLVPAGGSLHSAATVMDPLRADGLDVGRLVTSPTSVEAANSQHRATHEPA
jgi:hypothetical protein